MLYKHIPVDDIKAEIRHTKKQFSCDCKLGCTEVVYTLIELNIPLGLWFKNIYSQSRAIKLKQVQIFNH